MILSRVACSVHPALVQPTKSPGRTRSGRLADKLAQWVEEAIPQPRRRKTWSSAWRNCWRSDVSLNFLEKHSVSNMQSDCDYALALGLFPEEQYSSIFKYRAGWMSLYTFLSVSRNFYFLFLAPYNQSSLCSRYADPHSAVAPHGPSSANHILSVPWRTSQRTRFSWLQTTWRRKSMTDLQWVLSWTFTCNSSFSPFEIYVNDAVYWKMCANIRLVL